MQDLGYSGEIFTWNNRQDDNNHIKERLDRFLASEDWMQTFPSYMNSHLVRYKSDHCPMLLEFSTNPVCRNQKLQQKPKKYELMWSSHEEHHKIVQAAWNHAGGSLASKLAFTLDHMSSWGKQQFGNIPKRIKVVQDDLIELNNNSEKAEMMNKILQKEMELDKLLESEEMWWNQRSRVLWLQHGDKNTKFFHQKATQRRKRNIIDSIMDK
jgi:hypothetical protein